MECRRPAPRGEVSGKFRRRRVRGGPAGGMEGDPQPPLAVLAMNVKAHGVHWFGQLFLFCMTFGVANLMIWLERNKWPKRMDDSGLTTRIGKRFAWGEFTRIVRVTTFGPSGGVMATRYDLKSKRGTVTIVPDQLHDGMTVLEYAWQRLPADAKLPEKAAA